MKQNSILKLCLIIFCFVSYKTNAQSEFIESKNLSSTIDEGNGKYICWTYETEIYEKDTFTYTRPTVVLIQYDDSDVTKPLYREFKDERKSKNNKYNSLYIPTKHIHYPVGRKKYEQSYKASVKKEIEKAIKETKAINEIYLTWFNLQSDSSFSMSNIEKITLYSANADEHLIAEKSKRGDAIIKDDYIKMIERTYIGLYHPKSGFTFYFRLDSVQNCVNEIYDKYWIYNTDNTDIKKEKLNQFYERKFPIKLIGVGDVGGGYPQLITDKRLYDLLEDILEIATEAKIISVKPVKARIGTKEGDIKKYYYKAYEYQKDKNGNTQMIEVGTLRAKKVRNNYHTKTTIETKPSTFKQIQGKKIEPGMVLKQTTPITNGIMIGYTGEKIILKATKDLRKLNVATTAELFWNMDSIINIRLGIGPFFYLTRNSRLYATASMNLKGNFNFNPYISCSFSTKFQMILGCYYFTKDKNVMPQIGLQYSFPLKKDKINGQYYLMEAITDF